MRRAKGDEAGGIAEEFNDLPSSSFSSSRPPRVKGDLFACILQSPGAGLAEAGRLSGPAPPPIWR
jgi:hypothetical protein